MFADERDARETLPMSDWNSAAELLALMALEGVGPAKALSVARGEKDPAVLDPEDSLPMLLERARDRVEDYESVGVSVIGSFDDQFPARLRAIPQAPAVLYVRGDPIWPERALAVVGTREPSSFGETATEKLTSAAAARGVAIISGLALGVDGIAHEAALANGAMTIAVLGSGLDSVSPRQHRNLADRILEAGGLLVSEQPFDTAPGPRTLVARNRLQSGLAKALLVGQTGIKGGTLHTVRFAAEQRRPVFCPVPRSSSERSAGLELLLNRPARELPDLLPAWENHRQLAERLGDAPLARPVTAESTSAWLDALDDLAERPDEGNAGGQLRLNT